MICQREFAKLTCYNSSILKWNALPKVFNPALLFRPIISTIDFSTQRVSILIIKIITNAYDFNNPYYIKDSFNFAGSFNDFQLPECMSSLA